MNAEDVLLYGHQTVLQAVDGLPEQEWGVGGVCGVWSVREIIAHLASFEQALVELLGAFLDGEPMPTIERWGADPERFNDDEVARRQQMSPAEVMAEYAAAHERTLALMRSIPLKARRQAGTLPWYGPEYDLEDFVAYSFYGHKREHSAQICVFRDPLSRALYQRTPGRAYDQAS